jgi:hypothetical protein
MMKRISFYLMLFLSTPAFPADLLEDMFVYAQTFATKAALVSTTNANDQRPTPPAYAGNPGQVSMTLTTLSAAALTTKLRHKTGAWPWVLTGAIGTAVCLGRVMGGVHFPSDIMVGAAMGVAAGTLLPLLHAKPRDKSDLVFVSPLQGGAQLMWMTQL